MSSKRIFWKDEYIIFLIIGLIVGFIGGKFYPQWSTWLKNPHKKTAISSIQKEAINSKELSRSQILGIARRNHQKVCIIGIDGATWNVVMPMVNSGKLPHLAKLMRNGSYGNLRSLEISMSPVIWTSIATGKNPDKHGIEGFIIKMPDGYEQIPVMSNMRKVKAIWNILSDFEKKVGVISWWVTRPPEKVNGFMVSDGFRMQRFTYPESLSKEIENKLESPENWFSRQVNFYTPFRLDPDYKKKYDLDSPQYYHHHMMEYLRDFTLKDYYTMTAAKYTYPKENPDFFGIYFPSVDALSHFAWKYMEPYSLNEIFDVTTQEQKDFEQIIPRVYQKVDQYIGELLKMLPPDTIIMVVSDHGFEARSPGSFWHWINLNKLFSELGLLSYSSKKEIDWTQTHLYELEDLSRHERILYLNMKGREPRGIIEPNQYENERKSIYDRLTTLKTESGKSIFTEVKLPIASKTYIDSTTFKYASDFYYGGVTTYTGDIYARINPDLSREDYISLNEKRIPLNEFIIAHPQSGDHAINGIAILSGGPIKKEMILQDASVLDIVPTVLYLMGLPIAKDLEGKVLKTAIEEKYLDDHPILEIPTYETESWKPQTIFRSPEEEKEYLEKMESLGYINQSDPDSNTTSSHTP